MHALIMPNYPFNSKLEKIIEKSFLSMKSWPKNIFDWSLRHTNAL